jgi:hypothetical protein
VYWICREFEGFADLMLPGHGKRCLLGLKEKAAQKAAFEFNSGY